jgi:hypothetical protein
MNCEKWYKHKVSKQIIKYSKFVTILIFIKNFYSREFVTFVAQSLIVYSIW